MKRLIILAALVLLTASPAQADYMLYGLNMDSRIGTVANASLQVQTTGNLWSTTSGSGSPTNTYTNSFSGINGDSYNSAWIVTSIYGGSNLNTAKITINVNGTAITTPIIGNPGGNNDPNPSSLVSGSAVTGVWVITAQVPTALLNLGSSSTNQVSVVVSDKTTGASQPFDGRSYYQSLITITNDSSLNNTLNYAIASGAADIGTSAGYTTSRSVTLGGVANGQFLSGDLYAVYTYGDSGATQRDALLLNGNSLLGNDVANRDGNNTSIFPRDFTHVQLTSGQLNGAGNSLTFTVDPLDVGVGGESSLRPQLAVFAVSTQAVPEPTTLILTTLGLCGLLYFRRAGNRRQESMI